MTESDPKYICIQTLGQKKIHLGFLLCLYKICYSGCRFDVKEEEDEKKQVKDTNKIREGS